jgi:hypothetical protein
MGKASGKKSQGLKRKDLSGSPELASPEKKVLTEIKSSYFDNLVESLTDDFRERRDQSTLLELVGEEMRHLFAGYTPIVEEDEIGKVVQASYFITKLLIFIVRTFDTDMGSIILDVLNLCESDHFHPLFPAETLSTMSHGVSKYHRKIANFLLKSIYVELKHALHGYAWNDEVFKELGAAPHKRNPEFPTPFMGTYLILLIDGATIGPEDETDNGSVISGQ